MKDLTKSKIESIQKKLSGKRVLVAFSGGVDSTALASIVRKAADQTLLLLVTSPTVPKREVESAQKIAGELGVDLLVKEFDWLAHENLFKNEKDRCFRCKQKLSEIWKDTAEKLEYDIVVEGTTPSEVVGYRPGVNALRESGVQSPFLEAGMTKDEIREYAREKGLSVANKPSMACLATRFPYGTKITQDLLEMVDRVEQGVTEIWGIECVRARYHGDLVRIEVPESNLESMFDLKKMKQLVSLANEVGFVYVTLDLHGYRTGAMNEGLEPQKP
jgi:uncharacterized protein